MQNIKSKKMHSWDNSTNIYVADSTNLVSAFRFKIKLFFVVGIKISIFRYLQHSSVSAAKNGTERRENSSETILSGRSA